MSAPPNVRQLPVARTAAERMTTNVGGHEVARQVVGRLAPTEELAAAVQWGIQVAAPAGDSETDVVAQIYADLGSQCAERYVADRLAWAGGALYDNPHSVGAREEWQRAKASRTFLRKLQSGGVA